MPLLAAVLMLLAMAGCAQTTVAESSSPLSGSWEDAYGLTGYVFADDGTCKIKALNLGTFTGTYQVQGDKITIRYQILAKAVQDSYAYRIEHSTLYLGDTAYHRPSNSGGLFG